MQKINLLICDDHQIFIDGIKFGIKEHPRIELSGEALSGTEALQLIQSGIPFDVVLLDVEFPEENGPHIARAIKAEWPEIKIIGLTMHDSAAMVNKMMKAGVDGYLIKNTTVKEIMEAIESVYQGQKYFKGVVLNKIIEFSSEAPSENPKDLLTKRELQILDLIVQGKSTTEIADSFYISIHTVNSHRKNMIKKFNLRSTAELVSFAFQNELLVE